MLFDWLRAISPPAGPRCGAGGVGQRRDPRYSVERYLTNTLFVDLVKEGWIGGTGVSAEKLVQIVEVGPSPGRDLFAAIDYSPETPKE